MTNTRYADDMLLYAKSLRELDIMSTLLIEELAAVGLQLNAGKTRILHTEVQDEGFDLGYIEIADDFVQILEPHEFHRYLGRRVTLSASNRVDIEFKYRKSQAWAAFHKHKSVLFDYHVSLGHRLKFFNICVTSSLLFELSVLPLSYTQLKEMDVLQRKMLRRIVG